MARYPQGVSTFAAYTVDRFNHFLTNRQSQMCPTICPHGKIADKRSIVDNFLGDMLHIWLNGQMNMNSSFLDPGIMTCRPSFSSYL